MVFRCREYVFLGFYFVGWMGRGHPSEEIVVFCRRGYGFSKSIALELSGIEGLQCRSWEAPGLEVFTNRGFHLSGIYVFGKRVFFTRWE